METSLKKRMSCIQNVQKSRLFSFGFALRKDDEFLLEEDAKVLRFLFFFLTIDLTLICVCLRIFTGSQNIPNSQKRFPLKMSHFFVFFFVFVKEKKTKIYDLAKGKRRQSQGKLDSVRNLNISTEQI